MLQKRRCSEFDRNYVYETMKRNMSTYFDKNIEGGWSDQKFHEGFNPTRIIILEKDGIPIGFYDIETVSGERPHLYARNLQISEEYRGHGIAALRLIENEARSKRSNLIRGKCFKDNQRALRFFKLMGFCIVEDIDVEKENSVYLEKEL